MASRNRKLRVLCLHGFRTNTAVMFHQVRGFRLAFGESEGLAEFSYLEGPFVATGPTEDAIQEKFGSTAPFYEWFVVQTEHKSNGTERTRYVGWEHSLTYAMKYVDSHGPFDIVLGFSQGGMIATLLTAHYQASGKPAPFKAVVLVGVVSDPHEGLPTELGSWQEGLKMPAMVVLGETDPFFETGKNILRVYEKPSRRFFLHSEGHKFPSYSRYTALYDEVAHTVRRICQTQTE
ncbi:hypothetical protein Ae201684_000596 [Aphanomyces euteiches]|uniref:Serine hydrolase domain-containing protein n=1 Tax=Aphanomyces euteiches TaxID=100861 RepID=A0A6G0XX03_9STRA|nr:hypothetical protein Ae201684_000596 [Aphanomyces euteiches]